MLSLISTSQMEMREVPEMDLMSSGSSSPECMYPIATRSRCIIATRPFYRRDSFDNVRVTGIKVESFFERNKCACTLAALYMGASALAGIVLQRSPLVGICFMLTSVGLDRLVQQAFQKICVCLNMRGARLIEILRASSVVPDVIGSSQLLSSLFRENISVLQCAVLGVVTVAIAILFERCFGTNIHVSYSRELDTYRQGVAQEVPLSDRGSPQLNNLVGETGPIEIV